MERTQEPKTIYTRFGSKRNCQARWSKAGAQVQCAITNITHGEDSQGVEMPDGERDGRSDIIAQIETQRQELEKTVGRAASCAAALRKLRELLDQERAVSCLRDPGTRSSPEIKAVMAEIDRVTKMSTITGRISLPESARDRPRPGPDQRHPLRRNGPRNSFRKKGRRTMGRSGDR